MSDFSNVKVGDFVTRWFVGNPMRMRVTDVDNKLITAGLGWQFEKSTGAEYDPDLGWGTEFGTTGSYLIKEYDDDIPVCKGSQKKGTPS